MKKEKGIDISSKEMLLNILILFATLVVLCSITAMYTWIIGAEFQVERLLACYVAIALLIAALYCYLFFLDRNLLKGMKSILIMCSALVVGTIINLIIGETISVYLRPIMLAGVLVAVCNGRSMGLYVNICQCALLLLIDLMCHGNLAISFAISNVLLGTVCGILFIFRMVKIRKRISIISNGLFLCALTGVAALVSEFLTGPMDIGLLYALLFGIACSFVLVLLFMLLLPIIELSFNVVTDYRLMELSDHSNEVLRELATKAPGTFNHCIIVSNLAEMCALAIGENANLARACAYYHDIGKMLNPQYFKENQMHSDNPHDDITPEASVSIIKNHTKNGFKLGKEHKLPKELLDVILEHHGTLPIKVFYYKALKYTDGQLPLQDYSYDGPTPTSKISAIMMIADAAEAAVRVSSDRSEEGVEKLVNSIIAERLDLNQFFDCPITMKDLHVIKHTIVSAMSGVYHERIQYPNIRITAGGDTIDTSTEEK